MEFESNTPDEGTAIDTYEAAEMINRIDSDSDSKEHPEDHVEVPSNDEIVPSDDNGEPTTEEEVETPEEQFFDFDGEQISLTDLRKGYLRQQEFTRKTQELADQRRAYLQNQHDVNELRTQALQEIAGIKQSLRAQFQFAPPEPNWSELLEYDPGEHYRQRLEWEQREAAVRQVYEAEQKMLADQAAYQHLQEQELVRESKGRFYEKYPELKSDDQAAIAFEKMVDLLTSNGIPYEQVAEIRDFTIFDILYQHVKLLEKANAVPAAVAKIEQKPVISQKNASQKTVPFDREKSNFNSNPDVFNAAALIRLSNL